GFSGAIKRAGLRKLARKCFAQHKDRNCSQEDAEEIRRISAVDDETHPVILTKNGQPKYYLFSISQFNFLDFAFWHETHPLYLTHAIRILATSGENKPNDISAYVEKKIQARKCDLDIVGQDLDLDETTSPHIGCLSTFFSNVERGEGRALGVGWRGGDLLEICNAIYIGRDIEKAELRLASGRQCAFC
ncbi:MAG: hypothetical protein ACPG06_08825, partial [Alphaproteobacteria bacterium]